MCWRAKEGKVNGESLVPAPVCFGVYAVHNYDMSCVTLFCRVRVKS